MMVREYNNCYKAKRPIFLCLYDERDLYWSLGTDFPFDMMAGVIYFGNLYTNDVNPSADKGYEYSNPELVNAVKKYFGTYNIPAYVYLHCPKLKAVGFDGFKTFKLFQTLKGNGVYLDNGEIGANYQETLAFFKLLRYYDITIFHHTSISPHWGVLKQHPSIYQDYEHYFLWGEQNTQFVDSPEKLEWMKTSIPLAFWKENKTWVDTYGTSDEAFEPFFRWFGKNKLGYRISYGQFYRLFYKYYLPEYTIEIQTSKQKT